MAVKLSTLSICLGLLLAARGLFGLLNPARFAAAARKFPRSLPIGYMLTLAGTAWFVWNVSHEPLADFERLKPFLFTLFIGVGLGTCFFVQDFLAVRGLSVLFLLLAKLMLDAQRWAESEWRLVIAVWAYLLVLAGMWFTISPWRLRDLLQWGTANETRIRVASGLRLAFGLFVAALGFTVF
jgi:glucan phosphoethanolaminetransferase (alkaline phosphatase superfamily)